jgi:ABC-type branched-subunit amino acid transport system ATPase component/ABC-type branched-subunit amino acid transport system permease subunit
MMLRRVPWPALLLVAVLIVLPLVPATPEFSVTLLNYIGLSTLVVLGLVLLTGVANLTSFGQAAFVGLGAYVTGVLTLNYGVSPWLTLPIGLVVTGLVAFALGAITLRLSGHYLPLGTLAWGISLFYLFGNMSWLGRYDGLNGLPPIHFFSISLEHGRQIYFLIWIAVGIAMLCMAQLLDSRPGRAIRALRGGPLLAESFGINTARYKIIVFVLAALLASVSGWLYAHLQRAINPTPFGVNQGIEYLFMAVAGGASSVFGALLGAGIVTVAKDQLQDLLPRLLGSQGNFESIVFGIFFVLLLQRAPDGLYPYLQRAFVAVTGGKANKRQAKGEVSGNLPAALALSGRSMPPAGSALLEVLGLTKRFGGLVAVNDISFSVPAGQIVGLIGPNGAGKSTTFNLISGVLKASSGEVLFAGHALEQLHSRDIVALGVARTFQHVKLMPQMTALENVALGVHLRVSVGITRAALRLDRRDEARIMGEAMWQLQRVGLAHLANEEAGNLALGQQRVLEIARALAADPVLLLLDEPAAGLRYREKRELADVLKALRAAGMTVLLVEHDMDFVMDLTDKLVVMDFGCRLAQGTPAEIRDDPKVLEAYLGGIGDDIEATP